MRKSNQHCVDTFTYAYMNEQGAEHDPSVDLMVISKNLGHISKYS